MNRRAIVLTLGVLIAGWLAFFGNDNATKEISEPVARAKPRVTTSRSGPRTTPASNDSSHDASNDKSDGRGIDSSIDRSNDSRNGGNSTAGTTNNTSTSRRSKSGAPALILALRDRDNLFGENPEAESTKKPAASNKPGKPALAAITDGLASEALFGSQTWDPPPPPPPKPTAPPPPVAPPIPFIVIGKKQEQELWEVYLARGDQTFIVHEKDMLDHQYRIEAIKPPIMTLTYIPLNQTQTLNIGETN